MTIYECKFFTYIYCPLYFIIEIYLYCLNFYYKNDKSLKTFGPVSRLGVVTKSFMIVLNCFKTMLQPSAIQFYLHVSLMYLCHFVMD